MIRGFVSIPKTLRDWDFWIRSIETEGEFTGTLTGMSASTTGTVRYVKIGQRVSLFIQADLQGTSNATAMTMTGIPSELQPANTKEAPTLVRDNGGDEIGRASITDGTITFSMGSPLSATGFTNTGSKGLDEGWTFNYVLD